jgi:hypothetical protein
MNAPADTSGAKNVIQQIKSTITYLKAVTFESICGLASTDATVDDDGNSAGNDFISEEQVKTLTGMIVKAKADPVKFMEYLGIVELTVMPKKDYQKAVLALETKMKKSKVPA